MVLFSFRAIGAVKIALGWTFFFLPPGNCCAQSLKAEPIVAGLARPTFAIAPDGDGKRLFVSEQYTADIRIIDLDTRTVLPTPFLDLPHINAGGEYGLQAIAFHPDYARNGRFFVNYSDGSFIRIEEYTVSADPNVAIAASVRPILSLPALINHNGGWLGFSPIDRYLYIATGDGGTHVPLAEMGIESQDLNNLKGKILRIDVDGDDFLSDQQRNYAIPATNPFVGEPAAPEVWSYGLRHPFRASFDSETGDFYIGEVGSAFREEINFHSGTSTGGMNYGWRAMEGTSDNPNFPDPIPPNAVDPIYDYDHGAGAAAIGGFLYRGQSIPSLSGTYFFSDWVQKQIQSFEYINGAVSNLTNRTSELFSLGSADFGRITSFGIDGKGEIYLVDRVEEQIYRIVAEYGASLHSPTDVWVGTSSGIWSDVANWQGSTAPLVGGASDQILEFNYSGPGPSPTFTNDLAGTYVLNGMILNSTSQVGFSMAGNALELMSNGSQMPFIEALGDGVIYLNTDLVGSNDIHIVGAGANLVLGGIVSGTGGLTINRPTALTQLSGANTFSGATVVSHGEVLLTGGISASSDVSVTDGGRFELAYSAEDDKIGDSISLTLSSGELLVRNDHATTITESVGPIIFEDAAYNSITVSGDVAAMKLQADSMQREPGSAVLFRGSNLGDSSGSQILFGAAPILVGGGGVAGTPTRSIIPLAVGDQTTSGTGSSFATYDVLNGVVPLNTATEYVTNIVSGTVSQENVRSDTLNANIDASTTINSLLIEDGGSLSGTGTLNVSSGNVLVNGVNGGIMLGSLAFPDGEAMIWTNENLSISGSVSASASFTKLGDAQLVISSLSNVVGETSVLGGSLNFDSGGLVTNTLLVSGHGSEFVPAGGTFTIDDLSITQMGRLELLNGQSMDVSGSTTVRSDGVLRIDGGSLHTDALVSVEGKIFFVSGLLDVSGPLLLIDDGGPLGATVNLDGPKNLTVGGTTTIGLGGSVTISGGALHTGALGAGSGTLDFVSGELEITNSDLTIDASSALGETVTLSADKSLIVSGATFVNSASTLSLDGGAFATNQLVLDGAGASYVSTSGTSDINQLYLTNSAALDVGIGETVATNNDVVIDSAATLTLNGGTLITGQIVNNGAFDFALGSLQLTNSNLVIDSTGLLGETVTLSTGKSLAVSGTTTIKSAGMLILANGGFSTSELIVDGPNAKLIVNGASPPLPQFSLINGATQQLAAGQALAVTNTTHIGSGSSFHLAGGALATGNLVVDGTLQFDLGSLTLTNQGFTVESGGLFGQVLVLNNGQHLATSLDIQVESTGMIQLNDGSSLNANVLTNDGFVQLNGATASIESTSFVNDGVIRGTGRVLTNLDIGLEGMIRSQLGDHLLFLGSAHSNHGSIEVIEGEIEFVGSLSNEVGTGRINARDAILRFSGGLENDADMVLSFGTSDVFGSISNSGNITVSGDSNVTFYGDVVNNGEIRNSGNSYSVFFGSVSGAGTFTGSGTVAFEGDVQPGGITSAILFDGNVQFSQFADLQIDIGGLIPGAEFDSLSIDGLAVLDGTLTVDLIDLGQGEFTPQAGDTFEILTAAGGISGQFTPVLPDLNSGLTWIVNYTSTSLMLQVDYLTSGDFDHDGDVDGRDFLIWQRGGSPMPLDNGDLALWQSEYGLTTLAASSTAVPEPYSVFLATFAIVLLTLKVKRAGNDRMNWV